MNQDERRLFLIEYLLKEDMQLRKVQIPKDVQGQRDLLRSLMNVRMPRPIEDEFLVVPVSYTHLIIKNLGFGESLIMLILAALLSIIIIICGFFMIYTVYFRFLRLLIIVPMGSIAFSTMGGNRTVSYTHLDVYKRQLLRRLMITRTDT